MADYTVEKIDNGIATLRYADNSWADVLLSSDMTAETLDDLALQFAVFGAAATAGISPGIDILTLVVDLDNKNRSLVALGKKQKNIAPNMGAWLTFFVEETRSSPHTASVA